MAGHKDIFGPASAGLTGKKDRPILCNVPGLSATPVLKATSHDSANVQVSQAMDGATYLLDFGEKLSTLSLGGSIPMSSKGCAKRTSQTMIKELSDLYDSYRLGGTKLLKVTVGSDVYSVQVVSKDVSISAEQPTLVNFGIALIGHKQ